MNRILVFVILAFALINIGCTKTEQCDAAKVVSSVVSAQIASQLECKDLSAVRLDLDKKLVDLKVCDTVKATAAKGAIGGLICAPVVDGLIGGALATLPAAWDCSGGKVTEDVRQKILDACVKALGN